MVSRDFGPQTSSLQATKETKARSCLLLLADSPQVKAIQGPGVSGSMGSLATQMQGVPKLREQPLTSSCYLDT